MFNKNVPQVQSTNSSAKEAEKSQDQRQNEGREEAVCSTHSVMPGMELLTASPPSLLLLPQSRGLSSAQNSFQKLFFFFNLSTYYKPGIERSTGYTMTNRNAWSLLLNGRHSSKQKPWAAGSMLWPGLALCVCDHCSHTGSHAQRAQYLV